MEFLKSLKMTGILTKQNAIDQALVGGGGGDKLTNNGLLQTLHVYHEATFDGKTEFANLEESSVTFNSRPVFENDFIVKVNQEPYTLTSILDVQDQLWSDKKTLFKNVEILDDTIEACLDKMFELTDTINNHLTTNPGYTQTQTANIQKSPTVLLNDVVENPDVENPGVDADAETNVELTPKVDETLALYDSMISSVTTTLEHFENNDSTLYDMTTDNTAKINLVNRAIDNINFDLGEKNKDIVEIYETLDEHKTNIETNTTRIDSSNEKIDKLQLSLKALVDQIQSLDRAQENHLDAYTSDNTQRVAKALADRLRSVENETNDVAETETNAVIDDAKVNDVMVDWITTMNDSFKHFEENDKTLKNNLESNYYTSNECDEKFAHKDGVLSLNGVATSITNMLTSYDNCVINEKIAEYRNYIKSMTITNNIIIIELYKDKGVKFMYLFINTGGAGTVGEDVEISIDLTNLKCLCKIKEHNFSIEINGNEVDDVYVFGANPAGLTLKSKLASPSLTNIKRFIVTENSTEDLITDNLNVVVKHIFSEHNKEVDDKFASYTTKSLISKSINCIFNEFIKNDQSKVNYTDEAARLISYFHISSYLCAIDFETIPSTMKYLVVYFYLPYDGYYYDQAFVMIYDNIQQSGSFVLFSPDNRYQFLTSSVKKNTYQTAIQFSAAYDLDSNIQEHFVTHDDMLEDTGYAQHFKYIKIIESDDELAYGELIGSLTFLLFNYKLSGYVKSNNSNQTITHYAPIEAGEEISHYKIGKPVYMSGHVYKYKNDKFISSTAKDSTDCICSVNIDGSYKEFVGIITAVDDENGCITFATHGDYLFYVDDANLYQIGDVLLYDGRILDEDYAMTLKIQQSIIGKVSGKINEHYLALFKA